MRKQLPLILILILQSVIAFCQTGGPKKTEIIGPTKAKIMTKLYSNYDAKKNFSKWFCTDMGLLKTFSSPTPTLFQSKILYADSLSSNSGKLLYVLLSEKPLLDQVCHGCAPVLKFLSFKKTGATWFLDYEKQVGQIGSFGEAPPLEVKKAGKNIGFIFTDGFTNMGESTEAIVMYAYDKGVFKMVLQIPESSYSNDGACEVKVANSCYSYDGKIKFIEAGKDFNDIVFTKKGTDKPKDKVVKIDSVIVYRFLNGVYARVK
ncbi:hypothetical protein [Mucilaginibacter paludis]|uniref:Secreted protein n=1 Tax=Mucilaginibacter paludis DSM 18603 TaxID=714943 RepID=H1YGR6_9SPHI|nr:hypothetical protein [Mucilaginibacter paludis]EHQ26345.1 hypothetical protein Mucpa_2208 [Mucilaginibacter paludis DSM 18603]